MTAVPKIKLSSGDMIPKLGLGTWLIGGERTRNPKNDDVGQVKSLKFAIENGFTHIRTAQNYAEGHCETLIGEAIKGVARKNLFLTSCVNQNFALDKESLVDQAKGSLKRLGIDYFDLYLIGAINPDVSVKDMMDGLLFLLDNKLAKNIGVSNYRLEELKFAMEYTRNRLVYNEMHYNLVIRETEKSGVLEFCKQNNIVLCAYRPLQLGQLAKPGIEILDNLAKKYGKTQSQISLKWLTQKEGVIAITKTLKEEHILQDLEIFNWELSGEDVKKLDSDFPIQVGISDCTPPSKPKLI